MSDLCWGEPSLITASVLGLTLFALPKVYFKISRSTAFLAHIKAHRSDSRDVDVADGEYIKSYVIRRLDQESRLHRWTPQEVDYSSLLLVCPMPNQFGAGSYVIDGVKNFLRIPNECIASNRLEGFLVNHKTGQTVTVNNRGVTQTEAIPSELAGFQLREETGSEWIFTL